MMKVRSPFQFKNPNDAEKEMQEARAAADLALSVAGDRARKCLNMDDFKSYREAYRRTEEKLVESLLKYNNYFHKNAGIDITIYAMKVSTILTRLEALRSLLEVIERDAQKGLKPKAA